MMKEIKFRIWNHVTKEMYYEDKIEDLDAKGKITVCQSYGTLFCYYTDEFGDIRELKIMQCLMLKDINGKEVYDKDIYANYDNGCIGIITYDDYGLWASEYKDGELFNNRPFRELDTTNFEVITNEFESPEWRKKCC